MSEGSVCKRQGGGMLVGACWGIVAAFKRVCGRGGAGGDLIKWP